MFTYIENVPGRVKGVEVGEGGHHVVGDEPAEIVPGHALPLELALVPGIMDHGPAAVGVGEHLGQETAVSLAVNRV